MTFTMGEAAKSCALPNTEVVPLTAPYGPESIEGYYDEVFAIPPMLELIATAQRAGPVDGVVVGCFDDTGVDAARTMTDAPVIGLCQAAMQAATTLAGSFTVVTTLGRSVPALEHLALKYGYERHCRRVRACEVPVLELENPDGDAGAKIRAEIGLALRDDGAEAIVLGCAGMVNLTQSLSEEFGVPVIEGVAVALKWVEALRSLGLKSTGHGGYARPRPKTYRGEFTRYAPATDEPSS